MRSELTTAQVVELLDVGRSTVNLWRRQGRFPGARVEHSLVGQYCLIPESDLKNFARPKRGPASMAQAEKPTRRSLRKRAESMQ
jgi:hypothetical protein